MTSLANVQVLVVDDNEGLLEAYAGLLKTLGFSVATAVNGQLAWEQIQVRDFDIVFTDIRMPALDGIELLKKIRGRSKILPCVLMTSGFTDYPADILFHLGGNGFLAKPVGAATIKDALQKALTKPEDLLKIPAKMIATDKINRNFKSFKTLIESGEVRFGNGGFAIRQTNPSAKVQSAVNFKFTFDEPCSIGTIEGTGLVQWVHLVDSSERKKGAGVEFKHLTDGCREELCAWIRKQQFESFIPIQ
jgi:CheY-like chemotaxis protein